MAPIEMGTLDLTERFIVLRRQEEGVYQCPDYLSPDFLACQRQKESQVHPLPSDFRSSCSSETTSTTECINEEWRKKICEWIFQVIDHLEFNREVASVSLNYLDRYLSIRRVNKKTFQLVAMASLFLAVKMYEPTTLRISSLAHLSRGTFSKDDIASMENSILWSLSWNVHPPTPLCFVRNFMSLLQESGCTSTVALEIEELARYLTEISVYDYYFTTRKPSLAALGALLTAFHSISESKLPLRVRNTFLNCVLSRTGIDPSSKELQECTARLCKTYCDSPQQDKKIPGASTDEGHASPVCVASVDERNFSNL